MLSLHNLNPHLLDAQYAVRGPIVQRAQELEHQGRKIIYCNIGNPQALKQKPLTYVRQVMSLLEYPELMRHPSTATLYPQDVRDRAQSILDRHPGGTGAYTHSPGIAFIRQAVADFIAKRDGVQASADHIILTDGASKGVEAILIALLKERRNGFMIPIPQYPLYGAAIALHGANQISYFVDEEHHWQPDEGILNASIEKAKRRGIHPVAMVVINPGNPTGAVLPYDTVAMMIRFARRHDLSIIADEVYQENVYDPGCTFHSFARVMNDLNETGVSLFSLHSVSKGFLGECGHRGGYVEFRNVPEDVVAQFIKLQSISLCANVAGQITTYLMVSPPQPGDPSYETYIRERDGILRTLKLKADILGKGINEIEGMSLKAPHGAMYAFVHFTLPADKNADVDAMTPDERAAYDARRDTDYCLALLEETGICVIPGSGFGQVAGSLHFRTTFLPPVEEIEEFVARLRSFHENYVRELAEA